MNKKKVLFLTGTRADFGKLKPLMNILRDDEKFEIYIFATGMHLLSKYGLTVNEIKKEKYPNIYEYINQSSNMTMDKILATTVDGLSNYVAEYKPDIIIVHGDRLEALAGAIVGSFNNIIVGHVEGGERSGTLDELIRHSVSKLSHIHFVCNEEAKRRLIQMGEEEINIYIIGSPDLDIMMSNKLPSLKNVRQRYDISFPRYSLFCYHPVTTEVNNLRVNIQKVLQALVASGLQYVCIYPNNDAGSDIIIEELEILRCNPNFRIFSSLRFEYYLTLLKQSEFVIGNSSSGIREAEVYGKVNINIGTRQQNRYAGSNIINVNENISEILQAIQNYNMIQIKPNNSFGNGKSAEKFHNIMSSDQLWYVSVQKQFNDILTKY